MKNCAWCGKVTGAIRILLGAAMLFFGATKIGAPQMAEFVGGAAHKLGLTFLSVDIRFWIAIAGELIAGALIISGYKARWGAILTLIIMVFAWNATGWDVTNINALLVTLGALIVLWKGPGAWSMESGCCGSKCPCGKADCNCGGSCSTGGCENPNMQQQ